MATTEYDRDLTDTHSYLGEGFEDTNARTVLDDTITHPMLVLGGRNVYLIPGKTLPLLLFRNTGESEEIRTWIKSRKVFGVLYPNQKHLGTTADLRGFKEHCSSNGQWTLKIKAQGSQRFEIVEKKLISHVAYMAEVRILPDFRMLPPNQHLMLERNRLRNMMSKLTPYPECVFNQCKESVLIEDITKLIEAVLGKKPPVRDPIGFSYWVAANLPINDKDRKVLLAANSSQERLFIAKFFLKMNCKISCRDCSNVISTKNNIFSMSNSDAQGTFVNGHGYLHEMLTVRDVEVPSFYGASSEEYSWFPGYAWNVLVCSDCRAALGWRFSTEKNLEPKVFYGLTRAGVFFVPFDETNELSDEANEHISRMSRVYLIDEETERSDSP